MNKVKIVCTLGPSCSDRNTILQMARSGMSLARFNFSHGDYEGHLKNLEYVRDVESEIDYPIGTILDTKGPEIRTGKVKNGEIFLTEGKEFTLYLDDERIGTEDGVFVGYPAMSREVNTGQDIFIDDGVINLRVTNVMSDRVICAVMVGGILGDTKGINIPGADITIPALAEKDMADLKWGIAHEMDYVAVSFVKNRNDILDVRKLIEEENGRMNIIAKIETRQAVENIGEILEVVDGIMIARGDLGVEIPTEDVPLVQKDLIDNARRKGRSVIVATQMLDSMIRNPRPTRAEASDVANAVLDGTDAVMLSGETAKGSYPVEAVRVMNRIVERAEEILTLPVPGDTSAAIQSSIPDAVSNAAVSVAKLMNVGAILSLTRSGSTAKMVSKYRPPCKIIGSTPSKAIYRELSLYWGVVPIMEKQSDNENEAIDYSILSSLNKGYINEGDLLVVTAGIPMGIPGSTNMMHLLTAGRIILRGLPYLQKEAYGKVCIAETAEDAMKKMNRGDILVVKGTDRNFVPAVEIAGGIITEQTGLTSHPAILALELGIPCILGAQNAMSILEDGTMVTLDGGRGMVYQGQVRLHA